MPIRWSPQKVSEAADMLEEYINQAAEPLEQARLVVSEARKIDNLPEYVGQYLYRLQGEIERAIGGSQFEPIGRLRRFIKSIRDSIPEGSIQTEQNKTQQSLF